MTPAAIIARLRAHEAEALAALRWIAEHGSAGEREQARAAIETETRRGR